MRIFLIGQCTLHYGRMEYGNIGNYYILEPFIRLLHTTFGGAEIRTTFQLSSEFCKKEKVTVVPMDLYYGWSESDLPVAYKEYSIASIYNNVGKLIDITPFIEEVLSSDLVIDFSGDIWGKNADLVGENRFLIGLLKDRVVQLLNIPIAMVAGSPGPFNNDKYLDFAKEVFDGFNLVTNREDVSNEVLNSFGFNTEKVENCACPAFIFEATNNIDLLLRDTVLSMPSRPVIGFILCGWNFEEAPFSKYPRQREEYSNYVEVITRIINTYDVDVCLMSHSNGFTPPSPYDFKITHGRDYPIVLDLYNILKTTKVAGSVHLLTGVYSPAETKAIISKFDMLISGRVHAAVAALSQSIPTVIIDYGHEPKAHKLQGFARMAGVERFVANPNSIDDMFAKVKLCWNERELVKCALIDRMDYVRGKVYKNFELLKTVYENTL